MMKVVVIGLDGATWNLIEPWAREGKLPNFQRLMENGSWGTLKSVVPISTAPSWKCYSTGKNPGKLGAYFWYNFDRERKKIKMVNSTSFKSKEIWDYLSEEGYKCGVINMPTTYPPKQVNGFMISGFNALDNLDYTYPKDLKEELVRKYGYKVNPDHALRLNLLLGRDEALKERDKGIAEIKEMIKTRFKVARDLWDSEGLDFLHLTIFYIDNVQHYLWGAMDEEDPVYGRVLPEIWELIDQEIGEFLQHLDEDTIVFIMSDHGFDRLKARFKFNQWLYDKSYLKLKEKQGFSLSSLLYRLGVNTQRAYKLAHSRVGRSLVRLIPHSLVTKMWFLLRTSKDEVNIIDILDMVDWERTKAVMVGESLFFVNIEDPEEYERFREKLIEEMKGVKDPETGEKIVAEARKSEEIYDTGYSIPDILTVQTEGYGYDISVSPSGDLWTYWFEDGYSAFHTMDGIFLAYGKGIKEGQKIHGSIYDLAPTILSLFGLSAPDMDGRTLKEIFNPDFEPNGSLDEKRKIKNTIESLKGKI
ncbi:MAG: alkaline phosphatase family protein [Archaeoglobaceae archaeon]